MTGSRTSQKVEQASNCFCSASNSAAQECMDFSLQTSLYMDYLSIEDQIVQMLYQQVLPFRLSSSFHHLDRKCTRWVMLTLFCE